MSVATSTSRRPARNAARARSRWLWLRLPWMAADAKTGAGEAFRKSVRAALGPAEHHGRAVGADRLGGDGDSVVGLHSPEVVVDLAPIVAGGLHVVARRLVLVVADQLVDGSVERGREEQGLARSRWSSR